MERRSLAIALSGRSAPGASADMSPAADHG